MQNQIKETHQQIIEHLQALIDEFTPESQSHRVQEIIPKIQTAIEMVNVLQQECLKITLEDNPAFFSVLGKVYLYFRSRLGQICTREEIKKAVWPHKKIKDSTLYKILQRLRVQIEPNPGEPQFLINVRGKGYVLRKIPKRT